MAAERRLVVTADDVGLHEAMNRGAIQGHRSGIITACSVVASGEAFAHAISMLREIPTLEVGVHLALVEERPLLPRQQVSSLVRANGLFVSGYAAFAARYLARVAKQEEIERELRAQIERVAGSGLRVTHLNGHQHLHLLPRLFELVQKLALEYRIGYVRVVRDRGGEAGLPRRAALATLSRLGMRARGKSRVGGNADTIGVAEAGHLRVARLIALFDQVGEATELVCHPAVPDEGLAQRYRWSYEWSEELDALCSERLRRELAIRRIELVRPSDISGLNG